MRRAAGLHSAPFYPTTIRIDCNLQYKAHAPPGGPRPTPKLYLEVSVIRRKERPSQLPSTNDTSVISASSPPSISSLSQVLSLAQTNNLPRMSPTTPLNPTATPFLPAPSTLPTLPDATLTATLDLLFEPSPELHALALPTLRTLSFTSYNDLISTLRSQLLAIAASLDAHSRGPLHSILGSHPRLGEPKKETLSAQSAAEQRHLNGGGSGEGKEEEAARLRELNKEYEERFPGLRYVVFVNGRGREEVMKDMRRRIERGDLKEEEREGIEVCLFCVGGCFGRGIGTDIVLDRLCAILLLIGRLSCRSRRERRRRGVREGLVWCLRVWGDDVKGEGRM
ncbi:OHCU decarboxylase-domain-containing protein [Cercophora scortea]|uniref:OHCU decarboxylase-domain-containing protein n=1 Tax=Cercophora scortea TaxID=314031 RepID=A0AAE0IZG6_9PEZI|nr:OHCU decarboxylase-domain-containing protein [Cercophora scortea]